MNTPRSKPPKRWRPKRQQAPRGGDFISIGLMRHPLYASLIGHIATLWPHVDDAMIHVFRDLLGASEDTPVRPVYRSVVNAQIRMNILKNLLEESRHNASKGPEFDEILSEFGALNYIRSTYLHGLWYFYEEGAFLAAPRVDDLDLEAKRRVSPKELEDVAERIKALALRLRDFRRQQRKRLTRPPTPPPESPEPSDEALQ